MTDALTLGSAWFDYIAPAAIRATLILLLTGAVVLLLSDQAARLRSLVWTVGLAAALLTPLMVYQPVSFVIGVPIASLTQSNEAQEPEESLPDTLISPPRDSKKAVHPQASHAEPVAAKTSGTPSHRPTGGQPATGPSVSEASPLPEATRGASEWIKGILGLVWLAGTLLLLMRLVVGLSRQVLRSQRLETIDRGPWFNDARRVARELNLWRSVRLVAGEPGTSPQTWGVLDPTIAIPSDAVMPDYQSRQTILRHELAHVVRFDALRVTVERLLTAVFWWNPLTWLASRQAHLDREQACDDAVLLRGARPSAYANQLLLQACGLPHSQVEAEGASLLSRQVDGQLVHRVGRILDPNARRQAPPTMLLLVLILSLILSSCSVSAFSVTVENDGTSGAFDTVSDGIQIHADGDTVDIAIQGDNGELTANISGEIRFGRETEIISISRDGSLTITDQRGSPTREINTEPVGSEVRTTYLVDGVEQPLDQEGSAWFDATLLDLFRMAGVNTGPRVKQILDRDGAAGILSEVDKMPLEVVRAAYLDLAIGYPVVDEADRALLLESLAKNVQSDVERARILISTEPARLMSSPGVRDATLEAMAALQGSPVEQRRALEHILSAAAGDEVSLVKALELGAQIGSDVELRKFLELSAPFVPGTGGASLDAWISSSQAIQSDVERGNALRAMLDRSGASPDLTIQVIESAAGIQGDAEKARLLIDVASHYRGSQEERAAYQTTAATIRSEPERNRALAAL